jgi:hypothetical protein
MSEAYETDSCVMEADEWAKVFREVEIIEGCNCTVLSIERIDVG